MDPNATWHEMAEAVANDDWETATERAGDLLYWIDRGGFPPEITGHKEFDNLAARNACDAVAAWDVV